MDHMRILGNEPSSVILRKKVESYPKVPKQAEAKKGMVK